MWLGTYGAKGVSIINCSNYGNITWTYTGIGSHDQGGGAFCGYMGTGSSIKNSVNYGEIKSTTSRSPNYYTGIGGFAGCMKPGNGTLINTLSLGKISPNSPSGTSHGCLVGALCNGTLNATCVCYKKEISDKIIGYTKGDGAKLTQINLLEKEEEYLKSQEFVNKLNGLIEAGKTTYTTNVENEETGETEEQEVTVNIDTTGYAKWVYNAGNYPTLDLTTKWNGTDWVKE